MKKKQKNELREIIDNIKKEITMLNTFKEAYKTHDENLFFFTRVAHDNLINVLKGEISLLEEVIKKR